MTTDPATTLERQESIGGNNNTTTTILQDNTNNQEDDPLEFEDWDGQSPFWIHCTAGSIAGVAEHVSVYPLDTVKTHIQCAACPDPRTLRTARTPNLFTHGPANHMWTTMRQIVSTPALMPNNPTTTLSSYSKLFRGVQTILIGCIPAHALYFSSYETVKWYYTDAGNNNHLSMEGAALAGAAAVLGHDVIMTPLDTIKQRLQLGHYNNGMTQALQEICKSKAGLIGTLYRSFPVTLLTNVPYGAIMVYANEATKELLLLQRQQQQQQRNNNTTSLLQKNTLTDCLIASSIGGFLASGLTTPLDRIKTSLQIQGLAPVKCERFGGECATPYSASPPQATYGQVVRQILQKEGLRGLWKGALPRVLSHTPAVAISWTTYETCKELLIKYSV